MSKQHRRSHAGLGRHIHVILVMQRTIPIALMVKAFSHLQSWLNHQAFRDFQKLSRILLLNRTKRPILIWRQTNWHLESGSPFWLCRLWSAQGALPWRVEAEIWSVLAQRLYPPAGPPFSNCTKPSSLQIPLGYRSTITSAKGNAFKHV